MKTIKIYKNYGCLVAEKRVVYTYGAEHPMAVCSDQITVAIPESWGIYESASGETMLESPWGWKYLVNEVLYGNDYPCLGGINSDGKSFKIRLQEVQEA